MNNENIKGIDVKKGLALVSGSKAVYVRLLKSFLSNNFCEKLLAAISSGDSGQISQTSHAFKGVAGNLHMRELYELCRLIESDAKEGIVIDAASENVAALTASNEQTVESINLILGNPAILDGLQ